MMFDFILDEGVGNLKFKMTKNEVVQILGIPNEVIIDEYKSSALHYDGFVIHYDEYDMFESFFLDQLSFLGITIKIGQTDFFELTQILEQYYSKKNLEYDIAISPYCDLDRMINFARIGLTAWIEEDIVNDICVSLRHFSTLRRYLPC